MLIPVLLFIVGLLCLIKGGDWFVDGATGIARRFHVPELLIGATVVLKYTWYRPLCREEKEYDELMKRIGMD